MLSADRGHQHRPAAHSAGVGAALRPGVAEAAGRRARGGAAAAARRARLQAVPHHVTPHPLPAQLGWRGPPTQTCAIM